MNKIRDIGTKMKTLCDKPSNILALIYTTFGEQNMNDSENSHILNATFEQIEQTLLNMSKPLQLITSTVMNNPIAF